MRKLTRRQILWSTAALGTFGCGGAVAGEAGAGPSLDAGDGPSPGPGMPPPPPPPPPLPPPRDAGPGDAGPTVVPLSLPGRVVEVAAPGSVASGVVQPARVRAAMARGMMELTGRTTEADAWGAFFVPSDVVVLKVNPFGWPNTFTHPEVVAEIVRGLGLAGVPNANIVVYDRYTDYLAQPGYAAQLPAGVRVVGAVDTTAAQTDLTGRDTQLFVEFAKVDAGLDATVAQNRRSYLADVVAQATKVVNVPVLKSHWTAGFTCALKNMTYGLVNNTARSHGDVNWTREFLPGVAQMKALRDKVVLHIADLLVCCYDKGPDPSDATFEHQSLAFATDPVALDRVAWKLVDDERAARNLGPVADAITGSTPEYVLDCAAAGLGVGDLTKIDLRKTTV